MLMMMILLLMISGQGYHEDDILSFVIIDVLNLDERFDEAGAVPGVLMQVHAVDARQRTEGITC